MIVVFFLKQYYMMYKFFLNLDRSPDRRKNFDDSWTRFKAVDGKEFHSDEPILKRMVSMWNINESEHRAKCGCFQTHYNMLCHIRNNKLNRVIVVEDDALQVNEIEEDVLSQCKTFTYLGGYFAHIRMFDGALITGEFPGSYDGLNQLDKTEMRILMTLAYYIPHWTIARDIIDYIDSKARVRAIDVMLFDIVKVPFDYIYPALFIEDTCETTIHKVSRYKHPNQYYHLC